MLDSAAWLKTAQVWILAVRRNALTPVIALVALLLLAAFGFRADASVKELLVRMVLGLVILFGAAYVYFAIRDPDRLQSEKYQIDRRAQELQTQSAHGPLELTASPNPELTQPPKALEEPER